LLILYDISHNKIDGLTNYKELKVEHEINTESVLSFSYPISDPKHDLIQEECYIRTQDNEYIVKEVNFKDDDWTEYICKLNIEGIKGKDVSHFETIEQSCTNAVNLALVGTGWTIGSCNVTKLRTVRKNNCNAYIVLQEIQSAYGCEMTFDAITKEVYIYQSLGADKGSYFAEQLNLKKLDVQRNSYDYITRLIPLGKDGLGIASINGGLNYVENYQYSNKIITAYWEDNRYTDATALLEDAIERLDYLSKPYRAYKADVIDLANINPQYAILDYSLGDTITLLAKSKSTKEAQRIIKLTAYPDEPERNSCEIANKLLNLANMQVRFVDTANIIDIVTTVDGLVDGTKVDGVDWAKVQNVHIITADIQDASITTAKIGNLQVTTAKIAEASITNVKIDRASINKLQVVTADIVDANITTAKIGNLAVSSAQIQDAAITTAKIGNAQIFSAKIADAQITTAKIGLGAITTALIATAAIGTTQIADGSITDAKIVSLTANKISAGTIDAATITVVHLNAANITVGTINGAQITPGAIGATQLATSINTLISTAQTTADGKNTIYYQIAQPAGGVYKANDIWYDTNDGYKMYYYNGTTWVTVSFGTNVFADNAITADKIADGVNTAISNAQTRGDLGVTNAATAQTKANQGVTDAASALAYANAIQIGGRNLLKKSNPNITGAGYNLLGCDFGDAKPISGELYTISIKGTLNDPALTGFYANIDDGSGTYPAIAIVGSADKNSSGIYTKTFTMPTLPNPATISIIYAYPLGLYKSATLNWVKIEKGNKATDWTPAPEDVDAAIATAQATANGKNEVTYSLTVPGATANAIGDIWFQKNASNVIISQWEGLGGTSWSAKTIDNAVIANLDAAKITAGYISVDRLQAGTIVAAKLATDTITAASGVIADLAIVTANIADLAVTGAKIANATIVNANIFDATIQSAKIAALDAAKITTGTLDAARIAAGTITGTHIAAGTITAGDIQALTLTAGLMAVGTITATQIAVATITGDKLVADAITAREIASKTITANEIVALTITAAEIAAGTITAVKIAAGTITTNELASTVGAGLNISSNTSITLKADLTYVNAIQIGGRNYYKSTTVITDITGQTHTRPYAGCENGLYFVGLSTTDGTLRFNNVITNNGYWTVSFEVRGSQSVAISFIADICDGVQKEIRTTNDNTWLKVFITANVTNYSSTTYNFVDFSSIAWAYFYVRNLKVEKGNKATDWTPAPEDSPTNANIIATINLSPESITIDAANLNLSGLVTITNIGNGTTSIDGANIKTGTINASVIAVTNLNAANITTGNLDAARIQTNVITAINNNATLSINAARLNLTGYITATNLATAGQTTINGGNITTGSISADRINGGTITGVTITVGTDLAVGNNIYVGNTATGNQKFIKFFESANSYEEALINVAKPNYPTDNYTRLFFGAREITFDSYGVPKWRLENLALESQLNSYIKPFYTGNRCYIDYGSGILMIRNSSGTVIGTIAITP